MEPAETPTSSALTSSGLAAARKIASPVQIVSRCPCIVTFHGMMKMPSAAPERYRPRREGLLNGAQRTLTKRKSLTAAYKFDGICPNHPVLILSLTPDHAFGSGTSESRAVLAVIRKSAMGDQNQSCDVMGAAPLGWRIPASRPRRHLPALVAAGIGLLLSLIAAYAVGRWEQRVTAAEFEGVAATELIVLQNGINEYLSRLAALRTLFESANEEITRSEFEVFSGRLFENHLGILRVSWIPRINRKERAEYEAAAVGDGISGYRIKSLLADGGTATAPQGDEYLPIFFSTEPKTSVAYGLDYSTDPERR